MRFHVSDLEDFGLFHEELRFKSAYAVAVNHHTIEEQSFSDWFQCYKRFMKANNPRYCYGASPLTFNLFGCHKLATPDVAKQFEYGWFHQGKLDPESGFFFVSVKAIAKQIQQHFTQCGFCPALTQEKIKIGMLALPRAINPEYDQRWRYVYTHGERTGVLPIGNDIVIATLDTDFSHLDPTTLLEVRSTPYIDRVFAYLDAPDPAALTDRPYTGLSRCLHCGAAYKPHTMICSRCKSAFWKYALRNLEEILPKLYLTAESKTPSPAIPLPKAANTSPPQKIVQETVSFDQLWNDPLVQKILAGEEPAPPKPASKKVDESRYRIPEEIVAQLPPLPKPTATQQELKEALAQIAQSRTTRVKGTASPSSSRRFRLHEKVFGLFSKLYRERKALETAFSQPPARGESGTAAATDFPPFPMRQTLSPQLPVGQGRPEAPTSLQSSLPPLIAENTEFSPDEPLNQEALRNAIKNIKPRQKSELSKRGVVRVIYHATMDKETCPLCDYLDGMVMEPDDPATDIFSPPLYPGCTCSREYVLKTEKPQNWPKVTFKFPPKELLMYLDNKMGQA